jgi:hypothetical protein
MADFERGMNLVCRGAIKGSAAPRNLAQRDRLPVSTFRHGLAGFGVGFLILEKFWNWFHSGNRMTVKHRKPQFAVKIRLARSDETPHLSTL